MRFDDDDIGEDCYKAFCEYMGYDYPVQEKHAWFAEKLWGETPGETWRAAWRAAKSEDAGE